MNRSLTTPLAIEVRIADAACLAEALARTEGLYTEPPQLALSRLPQWLTILEKGLGHRPILITAERAGTVEGALPLVLLKSPFFGRFLVSLPYVNTAGVMATAEASHALVDAAVALADEHDVRFLELRHEETVEHKALCHQLTHKVHMRLPLPSTPAALWDGLKSKLRSQVKSCLKRNFQVDWGTQDQLDAYYDVFCRNMRDLGTPVYSCRLFASILDAFPNQAELCIVKHDGRTMAAALLLHGRGVTEVPSASSLRHYNSMGANMAMYWHLLERAVLRGQQVFDFGRSTLNSGTYDFKKQWGPVVTPAVWQYYIRHGEVGQMRPETGRYGTMIRVWRKLPVWLTRLVGPLIVRGIP
jgi:FemAB-related protein (PEP-CTERM system-associated)